MARFYGGVLDQGVLSYFTVGMNSSLGMDLSAALSSSPAPFFGSFRFEIPGFPAFQKGCVALQTVTTDLLEGCYSLNGRPSTFRSARTAACMTAPSEHPWPQALLPLQRIGSAGK